MKTTEHNVTEELEVFYQCTSELTFFKKTSSQKSLQTNLTISNGSDISGRNCANFSTYLLGERERDRESTPQSLSVRESK